MNRLEIKRSRYFVPKALQPALRSSQSVGAFSASSTHRISDPTPSSSASTSATSAPSPRAPHRVHDTMPASSKSRASSTSSASSAQEDTRCTYRTSDNRRCRMLCAKDHPELCHHHAQMELRALERSVANPLAREILGSLTDLRSGAALNQALGNLFVLRADGRVSARRSGSLTYIAQLLLQSLAAIRNDWRGTPAPSAKSALTATLTSPLPEDGDMQQSKPNV
jgi:hypothetical protein